MSEPSKSSTILLLAPQLEKSGSLQRLRKESSYQLLEISQPTELVQRIEEEKADLILVDGSLPGLSLKDLVIKARGVDPDLSIMVMMSSQSVGAPPKSDRKSALQGKEAKRNLWKIGIDDLIFNHASPEELAHRVARSLRLRRLSIRCEDLTQQNQELWQLAVTDGLTRLMNRRHFNERLHSEFARLRRFGGKLGCIMADIDLFKKVNDTYGHMTGDRVLRQIADLMKSNVRTIDTVARYGGEEFILMMTETVGEGLAYAANKLRKAIESFDFRETADNHDEPGPEQITISLGTSEYPDKRVKTPEQLIELADHALYQAKEAGRNQVIAA